MRKKAWQMANEWVKSPLIFQSLCSTNIQFNTISGFGKIKHPGSMHNILQQGRLKVPSKSVCQQKNGGITESMICGGDGGVTKLSGCHGDSGGPFVCNVNGR